MVAVGNPENGNPAPGSTAMGDCIAPAFGAAQAENMGVGAGLTPGLAAGSAEVFAEVAGAANAANATEEPAVVPAVPAVPTVPAEPTHRTGMYLQPARASDLLDDSADVTMSPLSDAQESQ
jgi:hypothetical protein